MTGTVKFFNVTKGFGFITMQDGKEIFFHVTNCLHKEPKEGDHVEFYIGEGKRGPAAEEVKIVG